MRKMRNDHEFIYEQIRGILNVRIWAVSMTGVTSIAIVLLYLQSIGPQRVAVINEETGKTYHAIATRDVSESLVEKQLRRSTHLFCEQYYNRDYQQIESARAAALAQMSQQMREKEKDIVRTDHIEEIMKNRITGRIEWITQPQITLTNDPRYTTIAQFYVVETIGDVETHRDKVNVRLDWYRVDNYNYYERENGFYVVAKKELSENSQEFKTHINLTQ